MLDERLRHPLREGQRRRGDPFPGGALIAIGITEGFRQVLAVELANRESQTTWRDLLLSPRERGLCGVEFVVSDDHSGLRRAQREILPEAAWQRCYVHFLRNALDHMPRKADDDCLRELCWLYDRAEPLGGGTAPGGLARPLARCLPQALRLGGGEHLRDPHLLPAPPRVLQAPEEHQHAGCRTA